MSAPDLGRQKAILKILVVVLALGAVAIATIPTRVPLPFRLMIAATDLVGAAAVWLLLRQKLDGK